MRYRRSNPFLGSLGSLSAAPTVPHPQVPIPGTIPPTGPVDHAAELERHRKADPKGTKAYEFPAQKPFTKPVDDNLAAAISSTNDAYNFVDSVTGQVRTEITDRMELNQTINLLRVHQIYPSQWVDVVIKSMKHYNCKVFGKDSTPCIKSKAAEAIYSQLWTGTEFKPTPLKKKTIVPKQPAKKSYLPWILGGTALAVVIVGIFVVPKMVKNGKKGSKGKRGWKYKQIR